MTELEQLRKEINDEITRRRRLRERIAKLEERVAKLEAQAQTALPPGNRMAHPAAAALG